MLVRVRNSCHFQATTAQLPRNCRWDATMKIETMSMFLFGYEILFEAKSVAIWLNFATGNTAT